MKYKLIRVTTVLDYVESKWKEFWWRKVGFEAADKISKESSAFGTKVHEMIGLMLTDKYVSDNYHKAEFACAIKAVEYIREHNIEPLFGTWEKSLEIEVLDQKLGLVGHFDLAAIIDGKAYIVDFKTSNKMRNSFPLQKAAYAKMANQQYGENIYDGLTIRSHWNKETQEVEFEVKEYKDLIKKYWPIFKSCLVIYKYFTRTDKS